MAGQAKTAVEFSNTVDQCCGTPYLITAEYAFLSSTHRDETNQMLISFMDSLGKRRDCRQYSVMEGVFNLESKDTT